MPRPIRCVIMRGGTSKAVFLEEHRLPQDAGERKALILRIFGSPDKRQIDGLGGADPLTSKVAIIGRPSPAQPDVDLVYTFGQVEIDHPDIDYRSLCGNISAAVGSYAVYEKMVEPTEPVTVVRVFNSNLGRVLRIEVPVACGVPMERGDYAVPGVPGTGARIEIDFAATAGSATGALLPTGNPVDRVDVPGIGTIAMSLVDIGNAHVFVRAADVGLKGTESAAEIDADPALCERLEAIRASGAARMGMIADPARSRLESPAVPILGIVSPAADYRVALTNAQVKAGEIDLVSRLMFMQRAHKTYAGTSTVCTGTARKIPGTLVHECAGPMAADERMVRIGHPGGVITTEVALDRSGGRLTVERATLGRTARRIMEGTVYVPE